MSILITCPVCGKRNGYEFRFGGEERGPRPAGQETSQRQWTDYIHMRNNVAGDQEEWWYHRDGCGTWFKILRNTKTNLEVENRKEAS